MRTNLPRAIRALRIRRRWRQADPAARADVSRALISRLERGHMDGATVRAMNRIARALDATLSVELRWRGADLDRLIDRVHAAVQEETAARLTRAGWQVWPEVAFNYYGDRGSCDLVAWHVGTRTMLIVEVKSRIGYVQDVLRRLDVKVRLGSEIARQLGLRRPANVVRALVVVEGHGSRLVVAGHPSLFAAFALRGRSALRWLRTPTEVTGLLWFEKLPDAHHGITNGTERVRRHVNAAELTH